jgi:hypothetical protein
MPDTRAQLARDTVSAVLIVLGTAVLTWGAWQINRAAGGIVGGLSLLLLGVALGFGEVGNVTAEESAGLGLSAEIEEGLTPPEPAGVGVGPEPTSSTPAPAKAPANHANQLPADPRPTSITMAASKWIGVRGTAPDPPPAPLVSDPNLMTEIPLSSGKLSKRRPVDASDARLAEMAEQAAAAEAIADT